MGTSRDSQSDFQLLSDLVLAVGASSAGKASPSNGRHSALLAELAPKLNDADLQRLKSLAMSNHVIVRAFQPLQEILAVAGNESVSEAAGLAVQQERGRIQHALRFLSRICTGLEERGCPVTVIKSLDHWPDLGSDLDLYTDAEASAVVQLMRTLFKAETADRSWGDKLANKWNFIVPGLPELVEIHIGRLGQTGEQTAVTQSLSGRTQSRTIAGYQFRVLAPEDRIVISTLQRMYRHFYIRLCDVLDNAELVESGSVDFNYLHTLGVRSGLWDGIATYLVIVSEYVEAFRGSGLLLPETVTRSAKFGAAQVSFARDFLRVPILPHSLGLYAGELKTLLLHGQLQDTLRLTLLPGLATAAALEMKLTGSDKGIW